MCRLQDQNQHFVTRSDGFALGSPDAYHEWQVDQTAETPHRQVLPLKFLLMKVFCACPSPVQSAATG